MIMDNICREIRKNILKISHKSGHGHIPTCFSVIESIYSLYNKMKHNPACPEWCERDVFVLSKGHAALAQYCVMANFGYFPLQEIYSFGSFGSKFGCHADRLKLAGVEFSTGSLGHGIGLAVGVALGMKMRQENRNVFTLIGDGEANEGTVWEAILVAEKLQLNNLTVIYDNNMSHSRGLQIKNPVSKFASFGCCVSEVNGHNLAELESSFFTKTENIHVVVANTVKGCGLRAMIDNPYEWHRRAPNEIEMFAFLEELDEKTI